jgi:hypothetical protein
MKNKKISKKVVKKFKDVTEKLKMLQISEDAICDPILELLEGRACFIEYDDKINDIIYSGPVFSDICDELQSEQVTLPFKYWPHLKELEILASKYDYIMVIDNKR